MDLSFPKDSAVNEYIKKDTYLKEKMEVIYPKVDDFNQILSKEEEIVCFLKKDFKHAFRQIPVDPSFYLEKAYIFRHNINNRVN